MQKIGSRNFTANLLQSQILSDLIFNNIYTSSIGSITKFYNNVSRIGVTGYVTNKFRYFLKHSTLSTDKYEWHSINSYQSYRNSLGVISGTRTVDILFNYTISEIMAKRLFVVKNPNDKYESMFDFIISTSLLYIIITASLTIGGTDYLTEVENIAGVPTDVYTEEKKFPSKASQYINSLKAKYTDISDTVLSAISAILYGSFACKYVYDFHKRIKNNQHISNKEADFVRGLMDFSLAIYSNGTDTLTGLLRKVTGDPVYEKDTWRKENPKFEHMTDGEIKNLLNTVDCGVENIICRIMDINPIYTIVKYMYSINGDLLSKVQSDFNNNHPVSGGTPRVSTENDNEYDAENKWGFGTMFSKTTPSIIDAFIAGSTVGGDIKTYCDKLVSDVKFALEGDDITVLPDILKRSLVLDTLRYKNISKENEESIDKSLECVVDCISKFKSVVSTDEISCNSL